MEYFVLVNIRKLNYSYYYYRVVAILTRFGFISFVFVQESIFEYFHLYHYDAG